MSAPHILVIEDDAADYELVQHALRKGGLAFTSKRVEASDELFRELGEHPPDLVLSDHGLREADSLTLLALIRHRLPDVPFVLVTGGMREEDMAEAFARGADDCIYKHRLPELATAVHRALQMGGLRRRLREAEQERDRLRAELAKAREGAGAEPRILTLCAACKRMREGTEWPRLETYFRRHYGIEFTHGMCPQCVENYYTGLI
jgi:CheY-like chemotaxis protein